MVDIGGHSVGLNDPPFLIAEMSGNHGGSLDNALRLVEVAAEAGAHALKIQTYTPDTMTLDLAEGEFLIADPTSLWKGQSLHQLYEKAHTPWEWHAPIFDRARELGMVAFSTPFDETAVDLLESLDVPCYKIASFENTDIPLIRRVAATGKPMLMSTGMASADELTESVEAARAAGCDDLVLLKCTSTYPASPEHSNLSTIPHMRSTFGCEVGLSDHTLGIGVAVAAVGVGACVLEKHMTLDRNDGGVDSSFSLEPQEFAQLVAEATRAWQALGRIAYGPTPDEEKTVLRRRSIYVTEDLETGATLSRENLRCIRPGLGLPPKHYEALLGRHVNKAVKRGTPMRWELLE